MTYLEFIPDHETIFVYYFDGYFNKMHAVVQVDDLITVKQLLLL